MADSHLTADEDLEDMAYMNYRGITRTLVLAAVCAGGVAIHHLCASKDDESVQPTSEADGWSTSEADGWFNHFLGIALLAAFVADRVRSRPQRDATANAPPSAPRPCSRAIFDAADSGDVERLQQLLAHGAGGIDWVNSIGRSALVQACAKQRPVVARLLLEAGADCASKDAQGRGALEWALHWRHASDPSPHMRNVNEHAAVVLRLLETRRKRAVALRRWRVSARAVGAWSDLWRVAKEARYAPDGPGYEEARRNFEEACATEALPRTCGDAGGM